MAKKPLLKVVIGDTHCGSTVGLFPPGMKFGQPPKLRNQTAFQEWSWDCWVNLWTKRIPEIAGNDKYDLIHMGDAIDGIHHGTTEIESTDWGDHCQIFQAAMEIPLLKAARYFQVVGTECHVRNTEHRIGKALGAEVDQSTGLHAFQRIVMDTNGYRVVYRHHTSSSLRKVNSSSKLSIHLGDEQVRAASVDHKAPKGLVCAHCHDPEILLSGLRRFSAITPAWQGLTNFGHRVVSPAVLEPGALIIDHRGKKEGERPDVYHVLYECLRPEVVE
jgi:hypothetical protein